MTNQKTPIRLFSTDVFGDRVAHFYRLTNPLLLLQSKENEDKALGYYKQFKANGELPTGLSVDAMRYQATIAETAFAKDGDRIPKPFRVSGYALANLPIAVGLMVATQSIPAVVFFQFANQTQNAMLNHYNRSGAEKIDPKVIGTSYVGAVTTALTISLGSSALISKIANQSTRALLARFVPFLSVSTANVLNTFLMRKHEMGEGTIVCTEDGKEVGRSQIAAKQAITQTCLSRAFMSFTLLGLPPIAFALFEKTKLIRSKPMLKLPMQIGVTAAFMFTIIPFSVALFAPQIRTNSNVLEPKFKEELGANVPLKFEKGL